MITSPNAEAAASAVSSQRPAEGLGFCRVQPTIPQKEDPNMETWDDIQKLANEPRPEILDFSLSEVLDAIKPFARKLIISRADNGDIRIEDGTGDLELRIVLGSDPKSPSPYRIYDCVNNHAYVDLLYVETVIKMALGVYTELDLLYSELMHA